jgi:hypothetical protein
MYPNSALSAWQLTIMAVVVVVALAVWLGAVYLAAREPARHDQAAAGSPAESATAGTGSRAPAPAGGREPARPPAPGRAAA